MYRRLATAFAALMAATPVAHATQTSPHEAEAALSSAMGSIEGAENWLHRYGNSSPHLRQVVIAELNRFACVGQSGKDRGGCSDVPEHSHRAGYGG